MKNEFSNDFIAINKFNFMLNGRLGGVIKENTEVQDQIFFSKIPIILFFIFYCTMSSNPETLELQLKYLNENKSAKRGGNEGIQDVEYAISSNFLKHISSSLLSKQLQLLTRSNELIDQLENSKALESTTDLTMSRSQISLSSITDDFNRNLTNSRKLISRKSPKALPGDLQLQRCLRDIEDNCNPATSASIRNIIQDMKKMRKRIIELQANEKLSKNNGSHVQRLQQQNMILRSRIKEMKEINQKLDKEKKEAQIHLKEGFDENSITLKFGEIRKFINDKEKFLMEKLNKVTEISESIESVLHAQKLQDACDKCCSFMKRIKDSLVKYRTYLSEQETHLDLLYDQYKQVFVSA